ncbi:MAG TPA: hypothetical protein VJZ00_02915, partial [Thermoanaerobaculia bacterium]|nr:hypothetical protein [Thermoanaerobaculia bacterium]
IYHLRFPEMTLNAGRWAYDLANSSSFYPAAMGTLYLPALAIDAQGVVAQLVHYGFFLLTLVAASAIARRLGAATGDYAAILCAALPAAAIVAGWAWADMGLAFALATSALALLAGVPGLAIVLLALSASMKYTALIAGLPLFLLAVRKSPRAVLLGVLVLSPWYATNALRTGNPIYPIGEATHPAAEMVATWSGESRLDVWTNYFARPQTLDEDVGGLLFLVVAVTGLALARKQRATFVVLAMWVLYLPLTAAMRLLLPAVLATLIVAGAALEQFERKHVAIALVAAFALRGALVAIAHNARFFNPLPAAVGIEDERAYVERNFAPARLFARADTLLPRDARLLAINEVRLFRFPRPVTASRVLDPPLLRRYTSGARDVAEVVRRLRADGITHLLAAARPVERGTGIALTADEDRLTRALLHESRMLHRDGAVALFELPR